MTARPQRCRPALEAVVAGLLTLVAVLLPLPAGAATPQLKVAVDNGRTDAVAGKSSVYEVTVTNLGSTKVRHLRLSQSVPAGAQLVSVGKGGKLAKGQVTWTVDLPAAGSRTVRTTMKVDRKTPDSLLRLATVACVRQTTDGPPLVCAADSDQLPAGAAAAATKASTTRSALPAGATVPSWTYPAVGAALLVLIGGATAVVLRRRRRALSAGGVGTPQ